MHWFPSGERGLALGLRQTAVPISGFLASLGLPPIEHAGGVPWALAAMGIACLAGAGVGGLVVREGPGRDEESAALVASPLRDSRLWRLSVGSALVIAPQMCVGGFAVVFLHDRRNLSTSTAALILAAMQLLAVGARIGAGRWSDLVRSRLVPLRRISLAAAVLVGATGLLVAAPLAALVPVLVAGGVVAMSWNSLSFAAAVELAGHERSGVAIGLQQTMLSLSAVYPATFGALVGATSWEVAFVALAAFPLVGWQVLRPLPG
jgi:sugar phosphate permease